MGYKFVSKKKYFRQGVSSLVYVLTILLLSTYSYFAFNLGEFISPVLALVIIGLMVFNVYRAFYFFKLHKKEYFIIDDGSLSIYRGALIPRKQILFSKVIRVVDVNGILIFLLDDGKEVPVYTEYLSSEDRVEIKEKIKSIFTQKTLGF